MLALGDNRVLEAMN